MLIRPIQGLGLPTGIKFPAPDIVEPVSATERLSVRLGSDDLLLLRERGKARAMPTSTYVSLLVRPPSPTRPDAAAYR